MLRGSGFAPADHTVLVDGKPTIRHGDYDCPLPAHLPPILERLGMESRHWVPLIRGFGKLFHRVAGAPRTLGRHGRWKRFRPGRAERLGTA